MIQRRRPPRLFTLIFLIVVVVLAMRLLKDYASRASEADPGAPPPAPG